VRAGEIGQTKSKTRWNKWYKTRVGIGLEVQKFVEMQPTIECVWQGKILKEKEEARLAEAFAKFEI
jgi:hypothetical protein